MIIKILTMENVNNIQYTRESIHLRKIIKKYYNYHNFTYNMFQYVITGEILPFDPISTIYQLIYLDTSPLLIINYSNNEDLRPIIIRYFHLLNAMTYLYSNDESFKDLDIDTTSLSSPEFTNPIIEIYTRFIKNNPRDNLSTIQRLFDLMKVLNINFQFIVEE